MVNSCVVFVSNKAYLGELIRTLKSLRTIGNYNGQIVILRGSDWNEENNTEFLEYKKDYSETDLIQVIEFPEIDLTHIKNVFQQFPYTSPFDCRTDKLFQLHKMHVFQTFVKEWEVVLYIDANVKIHRSIEDVWNLDWKEKLISYDETLRSPPGWTLAGQFCTDIQNPYTKDLLQDFNLNCNYFQSSFMLFDTRIVNETTFTELIAFMNKYPTAKTNEQAIMSLYFGNHLKLFKALPDKNPIFHYYKESDVHQIFSKK